MHSGPHKGYLQVVAKYCTLQVGYHKKTESILWFNQLSITLIHKMNTVRFLVTTYCKVQCIALCRVVSSKRLHIQFQSSYTQSHNHGMGIPNHYTNYMKPAHINKHVVPALCCY